ncbi:MAG: exonuclease SbcCD subunit D [Eubacteriales bacterium]|nr:exonuclease SbcCD subunit D [Eubacteriales bacterium]
MKFIHVSDLHLGKRVNEFSMIEDQKYILKQILEITQEQKADALLAAGDIYDKTVPPAEAVQLLDSFLTEAARAGLPVFLISGNHDSPERMAFGEKLFHANKIHISPVYAGTVNPVVLRDEYGEVNIYPVPFLKPASVRRFFPEKEIKDYEAAFAAVMEELEIDTSKRNILMAHQFFTGAVRSESEEISVGGLDAISTSALPEFDYVALGHIHRPQQIGKETVRYCGTPLKYSFSETGDKKSVTVVELKEKGDVRVETILLKPLHDMREIRGTYAEVTLLENYRDTDTSDYMHVTLTDEEDIPDVTGKLRVIYPNLMKLDYDNKRTSQNRVIESTSAAEKKTPTELFGEFYELQNNQEMTREQQEYLHNVMEKVWGEE